MKRFLLFALVATMFAACVTDATEDVAVGVETSETLTVSFEGDSRIQLQNGKTVWNAGDLVSVFYLSNANQKWQFQGKTGDRTGNLKRVSNAEATQELSNVVIVYPYNENYYINPRTCNVRATLPATQHYLKDSYGLDGNILISASEYNQFSLKNVCGWLKVQLKGEGQVVKTITVKGNNGEQVAGQIYINSTDATATLAAEMGTADEEENGTGGTLVFDDTIINEVTLDCGEGVTLGAEATAFYIALPPQTFEKGLTIEIESIDGDKMTKSTDNAIVIARNTIQPMAVLDTNFKEQVPNNEIWYTSSDGNIVTPHSGDYNDYATNFTTFGANIVSNTYENGKGVIKFDGDITSIGEYAFVWCETLNSITIPNKVASIGLGAFLHCYSLIDVTIPNSVTSIGLGAFQGCENLTSVTIPNSVTSTEGAIFIGCTSLAKIYGKFASADNRCLIIGGVLNSFAPAGLTSYAIPDNITSIGDYAFFYCYSLTNITIPNSVTSIGVSAFDECESLTSVTIPDSVTSIGAYAFGSCPSLKEVYCKPTTPPTGDNEMFTDNAPYRTIYVPTASVETYRTASYWSDYANCIISENIIFYEACGASVSKIDSQWPYVDQFTGWSKIGTAATNVIYDGKIASVRNSGNYYQPTTDAVGVSGQPYVFLNKVPTLSNFIIENIAVSGATQYTFKFNVSCQVSYENSIPGFAEVTNELIHLELGYDGTSWATVECVIAPNGGNGWYTATAEFKTAVDATKLYARFSYEAPASNGGARFDDFEIAKGGNGVEFTPVAPEVPELPEQPTEALTIPYLESFATSQGYFVINDVLLSGALTYVWSQSTGYSCMVASGYKSGCVESESWLISPSISLAGSTAPAVSFEHCHKFAGTPSEELTLWVSDNDGADWTQLAISTYGTNSNYNFVTNTTDLTPYAGKTIKIAFKYISTTAAAGTWEVKNFKVADAAE